MYILHFVQTAEGACSDKSVFFGFAAPGAVIKRIRVAFYVSNRLRNLENVRPLVMSFAIIRYYLPNYQRKSIARLKGLMQGLVASTIFQKRGTSVF